MVLMFLWVLGVSVLSCSPLEARSMDFDSKVQGKWQAETSENNIFEGSVHILTVKTRAGSRASEMLLIYDEQQRGFLCSKANRTDKNMICDPVIVTQKEISI